MKKVSLIFLYVLFLIILVPGLITFVYGNKESNEIIEASANFLDEQKLTIEQVETRLKTAFPEIIFTGEKIIDQIEIQSRTKSGNVKVVQVGNKKISGEKIRTLFELRSLNFDVGEDGEYIYFISGDK